MVSILHFLRNTNSEFYEIHLTRWKYGLRVEECRGRKNIRRSRRRMVFIFRRIINKRYGSLKKMTLSLFSSVPLYDMVKN